jgi:chromosome partitioning protein
MVEREIVYSLTKKKYAMTAIEGQTRNLFEQEFLPPNLKYDYVIFDCPPGISPLSEVAIRASDLVIVPTIPDFISVYGINGFLRVFWRAPAGALPRPKLKPHVLVTRFLKNVTQHKLKVKELEAVARIKDPEICLLKTKCSTPPHWPRPWVK